MKIKFLAVALIIVLCIFGSQKQSYGSHAMGADLSYQCLGTNGLGNMQYLVTARFYRDCAGIIYPTSITLSYNAPLCGVFNSQNVTLNPINTPPAEDVTLICDSLVGTTNCGSGAFPGVHEVIYQGTLTLPDTCSQWIISYSTCCRNNAITTLVNPASASLYTEATIDNSPDSNGVMICNSSPILTVRPVPYICAGLPVSINFGAVDPDGDSLSYSMISPLTALNTPIAHVLPLTPQLPLSVVPGSFSFDSLSGQISFVPSIQQNAVITLLVNEWRDGVLIGTTMRDIQIVVGPPGLCSNSIPILDSVSNVVNGNALDSNTVQVCPNTFLSFDILITDTGGLDLNVSSNLDNAVGSPIPAATITYSGSGDSIVATIQWAPLPSDSGLHQFVIIASNDGCPIPGNRTAFYEIFVFKAVRVNPDSAVYCGTPVPLSASGGFSFTWSPPAGLSDPKIYKPTASPLVPTTYIFTSTCGSDSVFVDTDAPFLMDAGPDTVICAYGLTQLQASTDSLYTPYAFEWLPPVRLSDPVTGLPNNMIGNPIAGPLQTLQYTLWVTGENGCRRSDTVTVNVSGVAPIIVATIDRDTICLKDTVQLGMFSNPPSCGITNIPCSGTDVLGQVGTSTAPVPGSIVRYPALYGAFRNSAKHQILYKASDLTNALGSGGKIKDIAFEVGFFYPTQAWPLENFEIKLTCTDKDSLTGWINGGLTSVFSPKTVVPTAGWNNHTLDFEYDWDGVSNLIVQVCFNNPDTFGFWNHKHFVTTTANTSVLYLAGSVNQCNLNFLPTKSKLRPNTRFNVCVTDLNSLDIEWTPSTGPDAVSNDAIVYPYAVPTQPTTYSVSVSDSGCDGGNFISVYVDNYELDAYPDTFICTASPVQLEALLTGNVPPGLIYTWTANPPDPTLTTPNILNPLVSPIVPTVYTLTITGGRCLLVDTVFINVAGVGGIPINFITDSISCTGFADGQITALPAGGIAPLTYAWSIGGASVNSISNLGPGTYIVTITDQILCQGVDSVKFFDPPLLTTTTGGTDLGCANDTSGVVFVTSLGGTPTYSYLWNTPSNNTTATVTGAPAGNFAVTVTDANGCIAIDSIQITEPLAITSTISGTNVTINGAANGTASIIVSGGSSPYNYSWMPGSYNTANINNLIPGTYSVTVTDSNGCFIIDSINITEPPPIQLVYDTIHNPCYGYSSGSINVLSTIGGTPPYTYTWLVNPVVNGPSLTNLPIGIYTLLLADANGDSSYYNIEIKQPDSLSFSFNVLNATCHSVNDGQATVNVTGGTNSSYSYNWTPSGQNTNPAIGLGVGNHKVIVTDGNGCVDSAQTTITQPDSVVALITAQNDVSCFGMSNGTATVAVTGGTPGFTYSWSGSSQTTSTVTNLPAGFHTVIVTDNNGCADSDTLTINQPAQISISITPTPASCDISNDGSAIPIITGGTLPYSFAWSPGNITDSIATLLSTGTYTLAVTDANMCVRTQSTFIGTVYNLQIEMFSDSADCFNGNDGFAWVNPLNGSSPYSYIWNSFPSQSNDTAINLTAGTYAVTVTDNAGCTATSNTIVDQPNRIILTIKSHSPTCTSINDGYAWVTASGGSSPYNYLWSNGSANDTAFNLFSGGYSVNVTDSRGCSQSASTVLTDPPPFSASLESVNISCYNENDGQLQIFVSGGTSPYSYLWNSGDTTAIAQNLNAGLYSVFISDANGCDTIIDAQLTQPTELEFLDVFTDSTSCYGYDDGFLFADAIGGTPNSQASYLYSIDGIDYQNANLFDSLEAGVYTVYVQDANGCEIDTMVFLAQPAPLFVTVDPAYETIVVGESIQLNTTISNYSEDVINQYSWSPLTGLSCSDCPNPIANPYNTQNYTLTIRYLDNCFAITEAEIVIDNNKDFYIPNAFTPNQDGYNDVFKIYGERIKQVRMLIYNRAGERVFESADQNTGWNGFYKGVLMNPGVYAYFAEIVYLNGEIFHEKGSVTLIR